MPATFQIAMKFNEIIFISFSLAEASRLPFRMLIAESQPFPKRLQDKAEIENIKPESVAMSYDEASSGISKRLAVTLKSDSVKLPPTLAEN